MKVLKKPWFIPIVLTILILAGSQLYSNHLISQAKTLSEKEVRDQLETMYLGGKVDHIALKDAVYEAEISRNGSEYKAKIDGETGEVLALTQTKKAELASTEKDSPVEADKADIPEDKPTVTDKTEVVETKPKVEKVPSTEKAPVTKNENVNNVKPNSPSKVEKKAVHITEQQAVKIALSQLNGEVNDVEFVGTTDGGYYLVEIEIDVDDGPDEATYQIHAISGKVLTVTKED